MSTLTELGNEVFADGIHTQKQLARQLIEQIEDGLAAAGSDIVRKDAVRVATTANGTLASAFDNASSVDGVTLATGDRILVKNQTAGAENGIYVVQASGAPVRATDADTGAEYIGATVRVLEGTANAGTQWTCSNLTAPTLGSTAITFVQTGLDESDKADFDSANDAVEGTGWAIGLQDDSDAGLRKVDEGAILDGAVPTPDAYETVIERAIAWVQERCAARSAQLRAHVPTGLAGYVVGANHVLCTGQSFNAGAVTMSKLLSTTSNLAIEVGAYSAMMVGLSERSKNSNPTYDQYGTRVLNALVATLTEDGASAPVSSGDIASGNYTSGARGETPATAACITFDLLWRQLQNISGPDTTRYDVVTNVAKTDSLLADISTGDNLARAIDSAEAVIDAIAASDPGTPAQLSAILDSHGQADNASHTTVNDYKTGHKTYRESIFDDIAVAVYSQKLRPPWFAMQAGGAYFSLENWTSQAQLEMGLDTTQPDASSGHGDYFCCGPDYPYPNWFGVLAPHPWANNKHPSANGSRQRGALQGRARYWVQALKRNWFPTHVHMVVAIGNTLLVGFACMQGPIRGAQAAPVGMTMTTKDEWGIKVYHDFDHDNDFAVTALTAPQVVDDLVIRIDFAEPFSDDDLPDVTLGDYTVSGITNIRDSFSAEHVLRYKFVDGYTDTNLGSTGYDDTDELEDIAELVGSGDIGNWAANQTITATALPDFLRGTPV